MGGVGWPPVRGQEDRLCLLMRNFEELPFLRTHTKILSLPGKKQNKKKQLVKAGPDRQEIDISHINKPPSLSSPPSSGIHNSQVRTY